MSANHDELMAKALKELRRLKAENADLKAAASAPAAREAIAIVGMACRFPGDSSNPRRYWDMLREGRCAVTPVPEDRREAFGEFAQPADEEGRRGVELGSFIEAPELFDAAFFGISPLEARSLDPQQRLLLELAWECLEEAGISPEAIQGHEVGVFVGMSGIDYALKLFNPGQRDQIDAYFGTGTTQSPAAGRLSYFLKTTGPSMVVDTACSSSLVALHLACEALRRGECEAALVGGVNRILIPDLSVNFAESGLLAADGRCYTFDSRASGYARGEGGGMLLLKRQKDAEAACDTIHALVLGSAVNQDGGSGGLTVPSGPQQHRVIQAALRAAELAAADVDYVETHGTATPLGDPIEAHALGEVFKESHGRDRPLLIGSVKTNMGHLEAAAGMGSVLKVVQALRHESIPPHINFAQPSPHIDWASYPLEVVAAGRDWKRGGRRRVAGVNGFGFAGTNAHVLIAEAPEANPSMEPAAPRAEAITLATFTGSRKSF